MIDNRYWTESQLMVNNDNGVEDLSMRSDHDRSSQVKSPDWAAGEISNRRTEVHEYAKVLRNQL